MSEKVLTRQIAIKLLNEIVEEFGAAYTYPKEESIHVDTKEEFEDRADNGIASPYEVDDYEEYLHEFGVCSYVNRDGGPSCLAAQVIYRFNPELFEKLAEVDRKGEFGFSIVHDMVPSIPIEPEAVWLLSEVQGAQDTGETWGGAVQTGIRNTEAV